LSRFVLHANARWAHKPRQLNALPLKRMFGGRFAPIKILLTWSLHE